ncbi:MAG: hypothetical protein H6722_26800 [Sandaracinus sp.]|nr:hypothetical protein [Sandaracinus sp.]
MIRIIEVVLRRATRDLVRDDVRSHARSRPRLERSRQARRVRVPRRVRARHHRRVWVDNVGREVRCAVVQCDDLERTGARSSWAVTIRLEDCCRVASHDEQARQLPAEIEARTVALLRGATRAAA